MEALAAYGIPQEEMVKLVENPQTGEPIALMTLQKHFRRELNRGIVAANAKVATGLFKNATNATERNPYGDKVAQFFWLKTRARWKERHPDAPPPPPLDQEQNRLEVARRVAFLLISEARKSTAPQLRAPKKPTTQPA